jgi:hypothetical protein
MSELDVIVISQHDADPGFQELNRLADQFQPFPPLVYGGQVLHAV